MDSIEISLSSSPDGNYELESVAECEWEAVLPAAVVEKVYYPAGDSPCSAGVGAYIEHRRRAARDPDRGRMGGLRGAVRERPSMGRLLTATVASGDCGTGGQAESLIATCHMAEVDNADEYDTHATEGSAAVSITDPEPVCPAHGHAFRQLAEAPKRSPAPRCRAIQSRASRDHDPRAHDK